MASACPFDIKQIVFSLVCPNKSNSTVEFHLTHVYYILTEGESGRCGDATLELKSNDSSLMVVGETLRAH